MHVLTQNHMAFVFFYILVLYFTHLMHFTKQAAKYFLVIRNKHPQSLACQW